MLTKSTNISKCFYTSLFFSKHIYKALNKTDPLPWSCSVRLPFVPKNWDGQWMTLFWVGGRGKENNKDGALTTIQTDKFEKCLQQWQHRFEKCIELRKYVEGGMVVL